MLGIDNYHVFVLSAILLNITPGSDTMYILGRTISQGKSAGLMSVFGIVTGTFAHTLFAAFGLSVVLMQSALAFEVIKWAGAGYLIYLGIRSLLTKEYANGAGNIRDKHLKKVYMQGFLTNLLNPKVALFFLAFLPQFVIVKGDYGVLPFVLLGLTFIVTGTIWCSLLVLFSDLAASHIRKGHISKYLNKLSGIIFVALGLKLLQTENMWEDY
jgi:threonine/homoserine/homoserine lactone efflux protein